MCRILSENDITLCTDGSTEYGHKHGIAGIFLRMALKEILMWEAIFATQVVKIMKYVVGIYILHTHKTIQTPLYKG